MAPEVFLPERQPPEATLELLKAVDSWANGMVLFILANPSLRYPYQEEVIKERSSNPLKDSVDSFREILRRFQRPQCADDYELLHATVWANVVPTSSVH